MSESARHPMIRAIYFDAIGTLIHPRPLAAEVYLEVGRRYGSQASRATCFRRFRRAIGKQELIDNERDWATGEQRERQRWRDIVAEVLADVSDPEACFAELYEHFAKPAAWVCEPETEELLEDLQRQGYVLGLASNYDHRLHAVVAGLPALRSIQHIVISSEVGWRKPAPAFFAALCRQVNLPAAEILYVGDDRINDYDGALAAGLQAVLFDPRQRAGAPGSAPIRFTIAQACEMKRHKP